MAKPKLDAKALKSIKSWTGPTRVTSSIDFDFDASSVEISAPMELYVHKVNADPVYSNAERSAYACKVTGDGSNKLFDALLWATTLPASDDVVKGGKMPNKYVDSKGVERTSKFPNTFWLNA